MAEIRVFAVGDATARLEIPQDIDEDVILYLFYPPMQTAEGIASEQCIIIDGLDNLQTLLIELGNIPGITTTKG